jgi:Tfp pilus assembly protein PilN
VSQQINLYRPIFRQQQKKFSARAMLQAGAVMAAGIVAIYGVLLWQLGQVREELRQAERRHADITARLQSVTQQFGGGQGVADRMKALEQEVAVRRQVIDGLQRNVFTNSHGYSDYFLALARQHVDGVWITGISITGAGEDLKFKGRTIDPARVPRLVQRLAAEKALAGREFEMFVMTNSGKQSYLDFTLKTAPDEEDKERRL